ncbi:uncharacterized protein LOC136085164 [Hydra vulgaris]|uniref:Uncharacterized protein LOC136085164 n=1 Tax=Hydra vulgaris TaxID=6087 RepID=A0ABM4CL63_HYDVU
MALKWADKLANELHRPVVKHFRKRKVIVNGIDEIWAADLVDMKSFSKFNDGTKYLLMVIDVFSKYGWIVPLKTLGVELCSTENKEKSCVVERWNRTMKDKIFKYFSANSTRKYIEVLDEMVNKYNNTKHSSNKKTPVEASDKKNENIVWLNLNGNVRLESVKPKFSIGDRVRITKKKGTFKKRYTLRRTEEVFTVSQVQFTNPLTYKITDNNSEEIQGTFYKQEMQKTDQNIFRIEKFIR